MTLVALFGGRSLLFYGMQLIGEELLFLSRLGRETMSSDLARKEIGLISFIGNLENVGDITDKNLMELARKKLYQGRRFSEAPA